MHHPIHTAVHLHPFFDAVYYAGSESPAVRTRQTSWRALHPLFADKLLGNRLEIEPIAYILCTAAATPNPSQRTHQLKQRRTKMCTSWWEAQRLR